MRLTLLSHTALIAFAALGLTGGPAAAVNLVPNDSFEAYAACPTTLSQMNLATPWDTPDAASPDYYNACASGPSGMSVPSNFFGSQPARTGNGYAGLIALPINDYREYIEAPLTAPLAGGVTYQVSFYVSLCDLSNIGLDRLGAYLSVGAVGPLPVVNTLPFTPQVESPAGTFLTDKTNWMLVSGSFTAVGGEDHIVIGNFHDNPSTNTTALSGSYSGCYYYIDDVTVAAVAAGPQACCLPDGSCQNLWPAECTLLGGSPEGPGTACGSAGCQPTPAITITWGALKARLP